MRSKLTPTGIITVLSFVSPVFGKMRIVRLGSLLVVLFSIILFLSPRFAQGMELDTDRQGMDYKSFVLASPDPNLCERACKEDPQYCMAWTYVKPGIRGPKAECWLKSGVPAPVKNQCCISGVRGQEVGQAPGAVAKPRERAQPIPVPARQQQPPGEQVAAAQPPRSDTVSIDGGGRQGALPHPGGPTIQGKPSGTDIGQRLRAPMVRPSINTGLAHPFGPRLVSTPSKWVTGSPEMQGRMGIAGPEKWAEGSTPQGRAIKMQQSLSASPYVSKATLTTNGHDYAVTTVLKNGVKNVTVINANGSVNGWNYDRGGNLTSMQSVDIYGNKTSTTFRPGNAGWTQDTYDSHGLHTGSWTYDENGNLTESALRNNDGTETDTKFGSDGFATERTTWYPDGSTETVQYNKDGSSTTTSYDSNGDATSQAERDANNNVTERTTWNSDGSSTTTQYNKDNSTTTTSYDSNGNATSTTTTPATVASSSQSGGDDGSDHTGGSSAQGVDGTDEKRDPRYIDPRVKARARAHVPKHIDPRIGLMGNPIMIFTYTSGSTASGGGISMAGPAAGGNFDYKWAFGRMSRKDILPDPVEAKANIPHKPQMIPRDSLPDPAEKADIGRAKAEKSRTAVKVAPTVVTSVVGNVEKLTDRQTWSPLRAGDSIGPGTIIRVNNTVGAALGVGSDYEKASKHRWHKIHSDKNHTMHLLKAEEKG